MKKKILAIIMAATMALSIFGCTSYQEDVDISQENYSFCNGYFTVINEWRDWHRRYRIAYANDTKVKYFIAYNVDSESQFGITPLYNADGTLQVYDGE